MEYIDGEDLASLLRRIGRLPPDKALDIARRLCAGLAAAHEKGVLHRDLKPANIMVDGRGEVRIMDFGLAAVAGQLDAGDVRHGTPAYMAPEQLAGREVTVRSDIYALGLVLYEVFTGKHAFEAATLAELVRMQETSVPVGLSTLVKDMDPAVERAILRCLAADPRNRPASAMAVAAALPGGDPLAAAVAAGETPSPEMVAAAGEMEAWRPAIAVALLVFVMAGLAAMPFLGVRLDLVNSTPFDNSPDALAALGRETLRRLGYTARPAGTARGFWGSQDYIEWMRKNRPPGKRWVYLAGGQPAPLKFWYRESPRVLNPAPSLRVSWSDPPFNRSAMVRMQLDMQGRLLQLEVMPPEVEKSPAAAAAPDWNALFAAAGLDPAGFQPVTPQRVPLVACDARAAWSGTWPGVPDIPIRIEAAAWHGKPVSFKVISPWTSNERGFDPERNAGAVAGEWIALLVIIGLLATAGVLAHRNVQLNRGDRRGAMRLALFMLAGTMLEKVAGMSHVPNAGELRLLVEAAGQALFAAVVVWVLYLALEPYVRSRWPQTLVSWSRVLAGGLRDPRVGADVLVGTALATLWILLFSAATTLTMRLGDPPNYNGLESLLGARWVLRVLVDELTSGTEFALGCFFLVFVLKVLLRKNWLAGAAFVVLFTIVQGLGQEHWIVVMPMFAITYALALVVLLRFGLVPLVVALLVTDLLLSFPYTTDTSAWYFGTSFAVLLIVLAAAVWGCRMAIGGRQLLRDEVLSR